MKLFFSLNLIMAGVTSVAAKDPQEARDLRAKSGSTKAPTSTKAPGSISAKAPTATPSATPTMMSLVGTIDATPVVIYAEDEGELRLTGDPVSSTCPDGTMATGMSVGVNGNGDPDFIQLTCGTPTMVDVTTDTTLVVAVASTDEASSIVGTSDTGGGAETGTSESEISCPTGSFIQGITNLVSPTDGSSQEIDGFQIVCGEPTADDTLQTVPTGAAGALTGDAVFAGNCDSDTKYVTGVTVRLCSSSSEVFCVLSITCAELLV